MPRKRTVVKREHESIVIVGRKRTGKSTMANKFALSHPKDRRVLIINVNNSPAYREHPWINYDQLRTWKGSGIYQFYDRDHERMFDELLTIFNPENNPFGGLIILEDCTKYIGSKPNKQIMSFLVDNRMWDADILYTFHALKKIPLDFWILITRVCLFKTSEKMIGTLKKRIEENVVNSDELTDAFEYVNKHSNSFVNAVIETGNQ